MFSKKTNKLEVYS